MIEQILMAVADRWMDVLVWVGSAGGVMTIVQLLRVFSIPQMIRPSLRPLIGPTIGFLAGVVSWATGASVDFTPITGALLGTTAGTMFGIGRGMNRLKGTGRE